LITAYLSLGSNVGDREAYLRAALDHLSPVRVSPIYETEPMDYTSQSRFLNLAAEIQTTLSPRDLLASTQAIERALGRERDIPKGPRTLDIDILFYDDLVLNDRDLEIPHPRIAQRRFVLQPLADIAPDFRHPVTGITVREMLAKAGDQEVERYSR
jgi:2-amino-4-hydroxy-6-hydroxymethyldihydropteridine diphosphokinase